MEELIKAVREKDLLGFLYSNIHRLTSQEIIDLVGELLYVAVGRCSEEDEEAFYNQLAEGLEDSL